MLLVLLITSERRMSPVVPAGKKTATWPTSERWHTYVEEMAGRGWGRTTQDRKTWGNCARGVLKA